MKSLSRGFLIAIGAASIGVTLLSSLAGFFVFRGVLEAHQRRHLAEYLAERHNNLARRFSALSEVHVQAVGELEQQARSLSPEAAHRLFEARYAAQPDGTRRSRDADFEGHWTADGDYVRGMGAFLSPRLAAPLEETALAAAFSIVHHFGQGMHSTWDNFYFATPNNKMVIYAPDRPDRLRFYRHSAPANLDFSGEELMTMISPAKDPERRTRCTSLQRMVQDPQGKRLGTACLTPVYLEGRYVGAVGSSLFMTNFLANAVRPLDGHSTSLVVRDAGDVLAFPGMQLGGSDEDARLRSVTERFNAPALMRRIHNSRVASGVLTSPDGRNLVAFARLDGPDWWFLLIYPKHVAAASAAASAAWILALGVVAALVQTALIVRVARERIVAPLETLARSCAGDSGASAETRALAAREDELGVLARALDVERENAGLVQSSLEARVQARTAELESSGREQARFLCAMSHELRTPLNSVVAVSQALGSRPCDEESRRMIALIVDASHRLERALSDMVDVASLDAGEVAFVVEPFDLVGLMEHAGELHRAAAEAKGVRLDLVCPPDCRGAYLGDADRITQILSHYLGAAVQFTDAGWVSLKVERTAAGALRFTVSDTGRGFDGPQRAQLFERRAADPGAASSPGLAVCRALARAMGGDVSASSRPGVGSMFSLTLALPVARLVPQPEPPRTKEAVRPLDGVRVLLAEAGASNQRIAALILEDAGAQLRIVSDGTEAQRALTTEQFDVALVDAHLPELDGLAVVSDLRARETAADRRAIPVVVMTATVRRESTSEALKAGADAVLGKPLRAPELLSALAGLLSPPARAA